MPELGLGAYRQTLAEAATMVDVTMVGDSENDHDALEAVGVSFAMSNASPEIRALAKLVVADCDHNGVAETVSRLFRRHAAPLDDLLAMVSAAMTWAVHEVRKYLAGLGYRLYEARPSNVRDCR